MSILKKYIFKEVLKYYIYTFIVFSSLFFFNNIYNVISLILKKGLPFLTVAKVMILGISSSFQIVIPMSLVISVLMALGRLASDNEIIVMRACGIKLSTIILPLLFFSIILVIINFIFINSVVPYSKFEIRKVVNNAIIRKKKINFEPKSFFYFQNYSFYVNSIDKKNNILKNIILIKHIKNKKQKIIANSGKWFNNNDKLLLILYNGEIQDLQINNKSQINTSKFPELKIIIPFNSQPKILQKDLDEMSISELYKYKNNKNKNFIIEMYNKISLPFSCIALALIAIPIGLTSKKTGKSTGFTYGISFIVIYFFCYKYSLISAAKFSKIPAFLIINSANIIISIIGIFLIIKTINKKL